MITATERISRARHDADPRNDRTKDTVKGVEWREEDSSTRGFFFFFCFDDDDCSYRKRVEIKEIKMGKKKNFPPLSKSYDQSTTPPQSLTSFRAALVCCECIQARTNDDDHRLSQRRAQNVIRRSVRHPCAPVLHLNNRRRTTPVALPVALSPRRLGARWAIAPSRVCPVLPAAHRTSHGGFSSRCSLRVRVAVVAVVPVFFFFFFFLLDAPPRRRGASG